MFNKTRIVSYKYVVFHYYSVFMWLVQSCTQHLGVIEIELRKDPVY